MKLIGFRGFIEAVGFPFDFNDLTRIPYNVKISKNYIELSVKKPSIPKLILVKKIELLPNESIIKVSYQVKNTGDDTIKSSGLRTFFSVWSTNLETVFHTEEGLISCYSDPQFSLRADHKSLLDIINKGWIFRKDPFNDTLGIIWDISDFDDPKTDKGTLIRLEKKFDLKAGETRNFRPIYLLVGPKSWNEVQRNYNRFYGNINSPSLRIVPDSAFNVSLATSEDTSMIKPLFIENNSVNQIFLTLDNKIDRKSSCEITLKSDEINFIPNHLSFEIEENSKVQKVLKAKLIEKEVPTSTISYSISTQMEIERVNHLNAFIIDSGNPVEVNITPNADGFHAKLANGKIVLESSTDYKGSPFQLGPSDDDINVVHTYYPNKKPYLWYNPFYGGIVFWLIERGQSWGFSTLTKCDYQLEDIQIGHWNGIRFIPSNIEMKNPKLTGIAAYFDYLFLPNSNILKIDYSLNNLTPVPIQLFAGISIFLNLNYDSYKLVNPITREEIYFKKSLNQLLSEVPSDNPWIEIESISNNLPKLGFIKKDIIGTRNRLRIETQEKLNEIFNLNTLTLRGSEKKIISSIYMVFLEKDDSIQNYIDLSRN